MGQEKIIEGNIRKYLKAEGYLTYKIHTGQYGVMGFPDLIAIKDGITSYFEVKQPGKKPMPIQLLRLKELRQAGCVAAPVWGVADVIRELEEKL